MDAGVLGVRWVGRAAGESREARRPGFLQCGRDLLPVAVRELPAGSHEFPGRVGVYRPTPGVHETTGQ